MFPKTNANNPKAQGREGVYINTHPAHWIIGTTPISIYTYNSCRRLKKKKNVGVPTCKERLAEKTLVADHGQLVR